MSLYFAYGSNMNHAQMEKRCPGARFLKAVWLDGYQFVYDGFSRLLTWDGKKGSVANIVPNPGSHVWGGLYEVTAEHIASLDRFEDIPISYQKVEGLAVQDVEGVTYKNVIAYLRVPQAPGIPTDGYRALILQGAKDCNLPADYIRQLEQI